MCIQQNVHKNRHSCNELHGFLMTDEEELSIYIKQIFNVPSQKKKREKKVIIWGVLLVFICSATFVLPEPFNQVLASYAAAAEGNKIFIYTMLLKIMEVRYKIK